MQNIVARTGGRNGRSIFSLSMAAALVLVVLIAVAPPARATHNDQFANAVTIAGSSGSEQHHNGGTPGATLESGEPRETESGPNTVGATVWYSWTASAARPVTFTTCNLGTGGDTTLGVYTGAPVGSLTTVAVNNDMGSACTSSMSSAAGLASEVSFTAVAGTTYRVQVGGYLGGVVDFRLEWTADPTTMDDCKNGGWAAYGFSNQGQCIKFVNTGKDSRP